MDTNKILKVLGLFFVVLGAVIGIGLILSGFAAKSIPLAFMGIVFVMGRSLLPNPAASINAFI